MKNSGDFSTAPPILFPMPLAPPAGGIRADAAGNEVTSWAGTCWVLRLVEKEKERGGEKELG